MRYVRQFRLAAYIVVLVLLVSLTVFVVRQENDVRTRAQAVPENAVLNPTFGALGPCPSCESPTLPPVGGSQNNPTGGAAPTYSAVSPGPSSAPCEASGASLADHKKKKSKHKKHNGGISKGVEAIIKFLLELLNLLLKLIGGGEINVPTQPTPEDPSTDPLPSTTAPTSGMPDPSLAPCPDPTQPQSQTSPQPSNGAVPSSGVQPSTSPSGAPVGKRIAYSADGNQHDDDDWASVAFVFAILGHKGMQANLVHLDYNNHIWDSNAKGPGEMRTSVNGGVQRWKFNTANVFDDLTQKDAAQANLVEEINKSTASDELWLSLAGPMETSYQALAAANAEARKHVKCVSHGDNTFNQTHAKTDHGGHSYDDLIALGCQRVNIPNQNSKMGPTDVSFWSFLQSSSDPNLQWLYTRFEPASQSRGDVSDAGMVWYTVTDNQNGSRDDIKNLFSTPATPGQ